MHRSTNISEHKRSIIRAKRRRVESGKYLDAENSDKKHYNKEPKQFVGFCEELRLENNTQNETD